MAWSEECGEPGFWLSFLRARSLIVEGFVESCQDGIEKHLL